MEKIELDSIKVLLFLIDKFNSELDIKYIVGEENFYSLDKFILNNGQYLLDTIDYINVYIEMFNRLNELDLSIGAINICSNNDSIYSLEYLESLLIIYNNQKDNYVVRNMLYNQRVILDNYLTECRIYILKLLKILERYALLINNDKDIYELYSIVDEDDDSDDGGESLEFLLNKFSILLKNSYGIKKKNIKVKVLARG